MSVPVVLVDEPCSLVYTEHAVSADVSEHSVSSRTDNTRHTVVSLLVPLALVGALSALFVAVPRTTSTAVCLLWLSLLVLLLALYAHWRRRRVVRERVRIYRSLGV